MATADGVDNFIQLDFTSDETTLTDLGTAYLEGKWEDWTASDGDPEVVTIQGCAAIIISAIALAAQMPKAAFVAYGQQMLGIPFQSGSPASATVLFDAQDSNGPYEIPAGAQISIDGYAFNVAALTTVPPGAASASVTVTAAENDPAYGGLVGASIVPISTPAYIVGFTMAGIGQTVGGVAPQTTDDYASDLSTELQLLSRTVLTEEDYEIAAVAIDGVLRAHCSIDPDTLDVEVTLLASAGDPPIVSDPIKDMLADVYASKRVVNFTVALGDPEFNDIDVTWTATGYPGTDPNDLQARGNAALALELSPTGWGAPTNPDPSNTSTNWFNKTTVNAMRLVAVLGNVTGIYEVDSLSINGGDDFENFAMSGDVPLPNPGTLAGTVTVGT